jgi:GGDEF domain-containing protein
MAQFVANRCHTSARPNVVARLGGDEFVLLGVECDRAGAAALRDRVCAALAEAGVDASVGLAPQDPRSGLEAACERADQAMYECKAECRTLCCT